MATAEVGKPSSARSPSAARPSRPCASRRRPAGPGSSPAWATTTAGRRWCCTPASSSRRPPGQLYQLPGPILLDVRQRPDGLAVVAVPRGRGRLRRLDRHPQPRRRPRPLPRRADREGGRDEGDLHPPAPAAPARDAGPLRPRPPGRPHGRGDQRGLRRGARGVRQRGARHLRELPVHRRPGEPDGLRRLRHQGRHRLEPGGAQRAPGLPGGRRRAGSTRVHHRLRWRPLPVPRATSCPGTPTASGSRTWWPSRTTPSSPRSWQGSPHHPGFEEALDYVSFQAAWLRACGSGTWEDVVPLDGAGMSGGST